ncbi:nesprin-2-like isoform X1 [Arapaima gigas]
MEQHCVQSLEDCSGILTSLQMQLQGPRTRLTDRDSLRTTICDLKVMQQTASKTAQKVEDLHVQVDALQHTCIPNGRIALTLKLRKLLALMAAVEGSTLDRLQECEAHLEDPFFRKEVCRP